MWDRGKVLNHFPLWDIIKSTMTCHFVSVIYFENLRINRFFEVHKVLCESSNPQDFSVSGPELSQGSIIFRYTPAMVSGCTDRCLTYFFFQTTCEFLKCAFIYYWLYSGVLSNCCSFDYFKKQLFQFKVFLMLHKSEMFRNH